MRKTLRYFVTYLLAFVFCLSLSTDFFATENTNTSSGRVAYNEETGYEIYMDDWAALLSPSEEDNLRKAMEPITAYGHVAFVSINDNPNYSVTDYAEDYGYSHFGNDSYTLVIIDMEYRKICVYSDGKINSTITTSYANTITDNVYAYASDGDYYSCAYHAFDQINTLLEGRRIAQPMKYISNALLAVVLALLINYFLVMNVSRSKKASTSQILNGIYSKAEVQNPTIELLHQTKRYSPQSSSSSGARGGGRIGGGSMGGFGGGGRSGGSGGSHSF